ncbi:MAG: DUF6599 family protein [Nitrospirota bacterium]
MLPSNIIVIAFLLSLIALTPGQAAGHPAEMALPGQACAEGWVMDGKAALFDKDGLFDRINGESELYFPYGFEVLAYGRYENRKDRSIAIDADVYVMGSLLDAFGMFANYRRKDAADAGVGAEGTITPSQLLFYQDRYLVRLQVTGATTLSPDVFLACARAIARNLPENRGRPNELDAFMVPAVVKKTERYIAQSLLGYDFFHAGLIADAIVNGAQLQVFLVPERTPDAARKTIDRYRAYLAGSGSDGRVTETKGRILLEAADPLYGTVLVEQAGRHLIGALRVKDATAAKQLIEQLRTRVGVH